VNISIAILIITVNVISKLVVLGYFFMVGSRGMGNNWGVIWSRGMCNNWGMIRSWCKNWGVIRSRCRGVIRGRNIWSRGMVRGWGIWGWRSVWGVAGGTGHH